MANTSFGWKNKRARIRPNSELSSGSAFAEDAQVDPGTAGLDEVDWLHSVPVKRQRIGLEDSKTKTRRLNNEGITLAENGR